jgi:tetratricopeptide (TPR) repeat protein
MSEDLHDEIKKIRPKTASFNDNTICDLPENTWSDWVQYDDKKLMVKWNYYNDSNFVIQIHDKQALNDDTDPNNNHIYYTHLQNIIKKDEKGYNYKIKCFKFSNVLREKRKKLILEVHKEIGTDKNKAKDDRDTHHYLLKSLIPALKLLNELGIELKETDFYLIEDKFIIEEANLEKEFKYYGIKPETLVRANKYHEPYTFFMNEVDLNYLLKAVGFIYMYSDEIASKSGKKLTSFKERLFLLGNMFADISRLYSKENPDEIKDELSHKIKRIFPQDMNRSFEMGMLLFDASKYELSIKYFTKALKTDRYYEPALHNMGVAFCLLSRSLDCFSALSDAIVVNPFRADNYYWRAISSFKEGFFLDAIEDLQEAIAINDKFPAYYTLMAEVYCQLENRDEALSLLDKAINLKKDPKYYIKRAKLLFELSCYEDCIDDCNKALKLSPGLSEAKQLKSDAQYKLK